jgi:hypothetical protein
MVSITYNSRHAYLLVGIAINVYSNICLCFCFCLNIGMNELLFATVDFPLLDKAHAVDTIMDTPRKYWWWDSYRTTNMLPLMTRSGKSGHDGSDNGGKDEFEWVDYTSKEIRDWFEDIVFPWMGQRARIMALLTEPNFSNAEHIDCDENQVGTMQHKFRYVVQGQTDTLYWITENGQVNAPAVDQPFLMDGGWPHGMHNSSNEFKLTLAVGAPWIGNHSYDNINVLQSRKDYVLPSNWRQYLKK